MKTRVHEERTCNACSGVFRPKHENQRYCAYSCAAASGRLDRTCELCGTTYLPPRMQWQGKYCSNKCATLAQHHRGPTKWSEKRRAARLERVCNYCSNVYTTPYPATKYCSEECRRSAAKERSNARGGRRRFSKTSLDAQAWQELRETLTIEQDGKCAICDLNLVFGRGKAALDHSHASGVIRGVLCRGCNHGLGQFRDDPEILEAAAAYLRKYQ